METPASNWPKRDFVLFPKSTLHWPFYCIQGLQHTLFDTRANSEIGEADRGERRECNRVMIHSSTS